MKIRIFERKKRKMLKITIDKTSKEETCVITILQGDELKPTESVIEIRRFNALYDKFMEMDDAGIIDYLTQKMT